MVWDSFLTSPQPLVRRPISLAATCNQSWDFFLLRNFVYFHNFWETGSNAASAWYASCLKVRARKFVQLVWYMLRVHVTSRLLVIREHKERVRGNAGLDQRIGAWGGIISGVGTEGTGWLSGGEKLKSGFSVGSIREGDTSVTVGSTLWVEALSGSTLWT